MPTASCSCHAVRIEYTVDPIAKCICHCLECRKTSGSTHGLSLIVPDAGFSVTGNPSTYTYNAHNGNEVTRYFCAQCGINLYTDGEGAPGMKFVKGGTLDDPLILNDMKPDVECFVRRRATWLEAVPGTDQKQIM